MCSKVASIYIYISQKLPNCTHTNSRQRSHCEDQEEGHGGVTAPQHSGAAPTPSHSGTETIHNITASNIVVQPSPPTTQGQKQYTTFFF